MTKNENRINKLFEELVPTSGKADSLAGELVRATARVGYRFFNDGDMVNQGYGKETCNPAARFLIAKGNAEISSLTVALWEIFSEDAYEKVLDTLEGAVADYIKQNPDLRSQPTKDKVGNHRNAWVDYYTCFAYASTFEAQEDEGEVTAEQKSVVFTVRWCSEVNKLTSTGFRVLFRGELYDITSVDPMNYGKKTIKLHCRLERRQK